MTIARSIARSVAHPVASSAVRGGGSAPHPIQGTFSASDLTPDVDDTVTFTFAPSSTAVGEYEYQLTKDGVAVDGATTNPYDIENWEEADDGLYRLVVSDSGTEDTRTFGPLNVVANEVLDPYGPELLTNTTFDGAVAGSPGTPPTGWSNGSTTGSIASVDGAALTFASAGTRRNIYQIIDVEAGKVYRYAARITQHSGTLSFANVFTLLSVPSGTTLEPFVDGNAVPPATLDDTERAVEIFVTVTTSGTLQCRLGTGNSGNATQNVTISNPSMKEVL